MDRILATELTKAYPLPKDVYKVDITKDEESIKARNKEKIFSKSYAIFSGDTFS